MVTSVIGPYRIRPWLRRLHVTAVERAGIAYSLHEYEHDPAATSYGDEAVEKLDVDPARLFKTLVVSVDGELAVACVPVSAQLDLKALGKRAQLADKAQAQKVTGYVSGGTSPLGQRKRLPTHVDVSALEHATILVNAGRRGLQLELDPRDLVRLTGARVRPVASYGMTSAPVELHVVSDATGETAARLVQALEAQFPDQEFVEIRHPRIESEEDLYSPSTG